MAAGFAAVGALDVAYERTGAPGGPAVVLLHGFPDDVRTWDGVVAPLATAGCDVVVPFLRGYGPTRLRDAATLRSGQQAALGSDLRGLMDALDIERAVLAGYDWGGRAACIVAALWPGRVRGLVSVSGYNIQNIAGAHRPADAATELRYWYQWYFHTERGRAGLAENRRDIGRLLWRLWSPNWAFDDATFERTAASWDNPDFVDIVIHSYRHRFGLVLGDPAFDEIERQLARQPAITVPTIVLHGEADGVESPTGWLSHLDTFETLVAREAVPVAGHFFPREAPGTVVDAVLRLLA